ncbi:MAG: hypothetical protein IJT76_07665 [Clostridia bacterium]|nr:hypothetical protein [Clostridia bacterium]
MPTRLRGMLEQIDREEAQAALETCGRRVEQYAWLRAALYDRDVSEDRHFRRAFVSHFKLRQKDRDYLRFCFAWLEEHKGRPVSFDMALMDLFRAFGILDPATASKLASAVDPRLPVWDSQILGSMGIRPLALEQGIRRVEKIVEAYEKLQWWYDRYLRSKSGRTAAQLFDEVYPDTGFSQLKKVDFVVWSILWS